MSTASRPAQRIRRSAGFTLIELSIVMFLVVGMTMILTATTAASGKAAAYLKAVEGVTERGQKAIYDVANLVGTSRRIFDGDAVGQAYLAALDVSRDPMAPGSRMPLFDESRPLEIDQAGDPRTGNVMLLVREGDPVPCVADPTAKELHNIDMHRLVCVYAQQTTRKLLRGAPPARDLVIWRSIPYPSYPEIMDIADAAEQRSVLRDLYRRYKLQVAWDPGAEVDGAFYEFDAAGSISPVPLLRPQIEEDLDLSSRGRLVHTDAQLARTDPSSPHRRAILAVDPPGKWSPDGLELKITGGPSARQVWIHLVVEMEAEGGNGVAVSVGTQIANAREY